MRKLPASLRRTGRDLHVAESAGWAASLGAGAAMIAVHHFGYWDYRGRAVLPAVAGCSLLSVELPPHARRAAGGFARRGMTGDPHVKMIWPPAAMA
ncbi:MAG TPA: hypothetical protein VI854_00540 [Acidimicrobiia bacterium]|nr:hypothetical protein [Acidimicrobiia bacterium]